MIAVPEKLQEALKYIRRRRFSGTVYFQSNQKFSCHVIQFKMGRIVKTVELYYHHYDTHTAYGFKPIDWDAVVKLRGFKSVTRHLLSTFINQQDN